MPQLTAELPSEALRPALFGVLSSNPQYQADDCMYVNIDVNIDMNKR